LNVLILFRVSSSCEFTNLLHISSSLQGGGTGESPCYGETDGEGKAKVTWIMPGSSGEKTLFITANNIKEPVKVIATAIE